MIIRKELHMHMRSLLAGAVVSALVSAIVVAQDRDPYSGTWKLNVAKSRMVSPATASKSETVVFSHVKGEESFIADAVTVKGEAEHTEYRAIFDGPPAPFRTTLDGKPASEGLVQLRKLDQRTRLRLGVRKDGTIGGLIVRRLSEDGKSITSSILRFEPDGTVVNHETRVFEKQ